MTEVEWLASASPVAMLAHLSDYGSSPRSLRYAAAVCRLQPELLTDVLGAWLKVIERMADGEQVDGLDGVQEGAEREAAHLADHGPPDTRAQYAAVADVVFATWVSQPTEYDQDNPIPPRELDPVRRANADLVRCIFGNPFRPVTADPQWLTSTVVQLAAGVYADRAFDRLPILADALQDAGCDNDDVLTHLRGPGPHARGCWVVVLVLSKS